MREPLRCRPQFYDLRISAPVPLLVSTTCRSRETGPLRLTPRDGCMQAGHASNVRRRRYKGFVFSVGLCGDPCDAAAVCRSIGDECFGTSMPTLMHRRWPAKVSGICPCQNEPLRWVDRIVDCQGTSLPAPCEGATSTSSFGRVNGIVHVVGMKRSYSQSTARRHGCAACKASVQQQTEAPPPKCGSVKWLFHCLGGRCRPISWSKCCTSA